MLETLNALFAQLFIGISKELSVYSLVEVLDHNATLFNGASFRPSVARVLEFVGWECTLLRKTKSIFVVDNIKINERIMSESVFAMPLTPEFLAGLR
jgi:hypothetical protein